MQMENNAQELTGIKKYFKEQNIELSFNRIAIQGLGGMAHGLFASLLIGTIIKTIGGFIPGSVGAFLLEISGYTAAVQGAAMALAIGYAMGCPPYVLYSLATVGYAANALGGGGGPLAVYVISLAAIFCGKLVSKRTPIDLIVTPHSHHRCGRTACNILGTADWRNRSYFGRYHYVGNQSAAVYYGYFGVCYHGYCPYASDQLGCRLCGARTCRACGRRGCRWLLCPNGWLCGLHLS